MNSVIHYDFINKQELEQQQKPPLSEVPELNQTPTLELTERFTEAFELKTLNNLIGIYYEHPYLDKYWVMRTLLAELQRILIVSKQDSVGVSQQLVDQINENVKHRIPKT